MSDSEKLEKKISDVEKEIKAINKRIDRQASKLAAIPTSLVEVGERAEELTKRMGLMIFKLSVLTEVSFICRTPKYSGIEIHDALIWALDMSDEWWSFGEGLSTREWLARLQTEYSSKAPKFEGLRERMAM